MPQDAVPLVAALTDLFVLGLLVAARNAARVPLGGVHVRTATLELTLVIELPPGALNRPAPSLFAVRRHRSSYRLKLAFSPAYHVTTG